MDNKLLPFKNIPHGMKFVVQSVEIAQFGADEFPEMSVQGRLVPMWYSNDNILFTLYGEESQDV